MSSCKLCGLTWLRYHFVTCFLSWDADAQVAIGPVPYNHVSYEVKCVRPKARKKHKELTILLLQHTPSHGCNLFSKASRRKHSRSTSLNRFRPVWMLQGHSHRADASPLDDDSVRLIVKKAQNLLELWRAASLIQEGTKDKVQPLRTPFFNTVFFLLCLTSPGLIPNPFLEKRFEPNVYVAEDEFGNTVGVVQTVLANLKQQGDKRPTVKFYQNVVVDKSLRRKGVATSLLKYAISDDSRFQNALIVDPAEKVAIKLYENFHFKRTEEFDSYNVLMLQNQDL